MSTEAIRAEYPLLSNFLLAWFGDGEDVDAAISEFKSNPAEMVRYNDILAEGYRLIDADEASLLKMMEWANVYCVDYVAAHNWLSTVLYKLEN